MKTFLTFISYTRQHGGAASSVAASQLQGPCFNLELKWLSKWSLCSPRGCAFPLDSPVFFSISQKTHTSRWTVKSKLLIDVNKAMNLCAHGAPPRVYSQFAPSFPRIGFIHWRCLHTSNSVWGLYSSCSHIPNTIFIYMQSSNTPV